MIDPASELQRRIASRQVRVGVLGLGYVGLPLCRAFWEAGVAVVGFDIDPEKVAMLARGETYLRHLGEDFVRAMAASGRFTPTADFRLFAEVDAILVCVPTPLDRHWQPDLGFVERSADAIASHLRPGQLVVLESTTYPGTTREIVLPRLEATGRLLGRDLFVAYSPEREDPGRKDVSTRAIPKLVGGLDETSGGLATELYRIACDEVIPVRNAEVAEAAKLLENIYRSVNIALVNEMKVVLTALGIDIWEVIEAARTKPFGFQAFYPGPGLGGHCIPIDPFYLTYKAREVGYGSRFIELAGEINRSMPEYVVQRTMIALNDVGKALRGSKILVLGLAYKPDVDDCRESPSFELIERFATMGAEVDYNDPLVPVMPKVRRHALSMKSVELSASTIAGYDCVVVSTAHSAYDFDAIVKSARLVVDTRNATALVPGRDGKVVLA